TIPPDSMGAVGTNRIMVMINGGTPSFRIQDRGGTVLTNSGLTVFWAGLGFLHEAFDPHIAYDSYRDRWIATAAADEDLPSSSLLIGVSATADPTGAWYRYRYYIGESRSIDFPMLGFNKDKIVVTFRYLASSGGTIIAVFDKETLYSGTAPVLGSTYSWTD